MLLGSLIALGTSNLWPVAWLIMIAWHQAHFIGWKALIPKWDYYLVIIFVGIPATLIFNADGRYTLVWILTIYTVYTVRSGLVYNHRTKYAILAIVSIHLILSLIQHQNGLLRLHGLASNASVFGLAGMSMLPYGSVLVLTSLSRSAFIGTIILLLEPNKKRLALLLAFILIVLAWGFTTTPYRFQPQGIWESWIIRQEIINGTSNLVDICITTDETQTRKWIWHGYGLGNYCHTTHQSIIHNLWILTWYELGVWSIGFWGSLTYLWWKYNRSIRLLLVVLVVGMFTPEFIARIEGIYMMLGLHFYTKRKELME